MKVAGVYAITCVTTGARYVGSTIDLAKRKTWHMNSLRRCDHAFGSLQKLAAAHGGEAFRWDILEEVPQSGEIEKLLCEAEIRWQLVVLEQVGIDLLISRPAKARPVKGIKNKTSQDIVREFHNFCLARGLVPKEELAKALGAWMGSLGSGD